MTQGDIIGQLENTASVSFQLLTTGGTEEKDSVLSDIREERLKLQTDNQLNGSDCRKIFAALESQQWSKIWLIYSGGVYTIIRSYTKNTVLLSYKDNKINIHVKGCVI